MEKRYFAYYTGTSCASLTFSLLVFFFFLFSPSLLWKDAKIKGIGAFVCVRRAWPMYSRLCVRLWSSSNADSPAIYHLKFIPCSSVCVCTCVLKPAGAVAPSLCVVEIKARALRLTLRVRIRSTAYLRTSQQHGERTVRRREWSHPVYLTFREPISKSWQVKGCFSKGDSNYRVRTDFELLRNCLIFYFILQ